MSVFLKLDVGNVYELAVPEREIPLTRLGDLICATQERFGSWSLVPWFYAENERRGEFRLVVIRNQNWRGREPTDDPEHLAKLRDVELRELCLFIRGFVCGALDGDAAQRLERRRKD